ncbi:MAG: lysozyme [Acidimicrobiales bacterium]
MVFPYDDDRTGPLRRIDRSEVTRSGAFYRVIVTGGTATIGYGDTDPAVIDRYWDRDMTPEEAQAAFDEKARGYWEQGVERWLTRPLATPWMGAALLSFAWNAGVNALPVESGQVGYRAPGLLRALNQGRWGDAAEALKESFTKLPGFDLRPRRRREAEVFLRPWARDDWELLFVPLLAEA